MVFEELRYIYKGTSDYEANKQFYIEILGASLVWEFRRFGTSVVAFRLGDCKHLILIAEHLKGHQSILIYRTSDIEQAITQLKSNGLSFRSSTFGIPDGNCILFEDNSRTKYGIYEKTKDDAYLVDEYNRQQREQSTQHRL